ncbi:MAG: carboxypeptidase regulatory-like domain-containing protein, partial [Proteobacteria bacterium]|nr:carboxypeptidase regulatory-like domain-containing protein [Pseudomonadota bacterium]
YGGDLNKGVFKSTDGARSFAEINDGIRANQIFSIDISPAHTPSILAGTLAGVYIRDETMRWNLINDVHAEAVAFHPQNDTIIYAGFPLKIGKSTDRGATWSYQSISSLSEMHDVSSIAVSSRAPELVVAGIYFYSGKKGRIIKSIDTGETYNLMWETTVPVNTVRIHPANPQIIFAGTGSFYAPVAPGGLFVSSDGGATWKATSLQNVIVNSVAISSFDPRIIYAGCGGSDNSYSGIYKSSDGGATWQKTPRGLPHEYAITALQIDAANMNIVCAASFYGGIYLTVDGGEYWTQIGLSDYLIYDVSFLAQPSGIKQIKTAGTATTPVPAGTIIAGTTSGIYQYAAGDTGTLCGIITSAETGAPIDAALVSVSCGSSCMSSDGYYLMLVPSGTHTIEVQAAGYERADFPGIAVSSGQSVSYDIALHPSDNTCPATALLLDSPYQNYLENLKAFRDRVLRRTSRGKELISLYYTAGAELVSLLNAHPELRTQCLSVMREIMPAVAASLADMPVSIPASVLNKIETVVSDIEGVASENMKVKIHAVQVILRGDGLLKILKGKPL